MTTASFGLVIIGRNEGERLRACLRSLPPGAKAVYVDSGSSDDSVAQAGAAGISAIGLTAPPGFSAARARNSGFRWLRRNHPELTFVMFVDGDCEVAPGWLDQGIKALQADSSLAVVFGRRRERFPGRSIYNALCDDEWNVPIGEAEAFGGDILCRVAAIDAVGGYREQMIAGEDPDLACRLRAAGWRLRRIDAEMTHHDAAILNFAQWWRRAKRGGHAFAELAHRHTQSRSPDWRRQCRSILVWGLMLPMLLVICVIGGFVFHRGIFLVALIVALLWPLQAIRLTLKRADLPNGIARANAVFLLTGKLPQFLGLMEFHINRLRRRGSTLIEYKSAAQ